jgi:hypothetical protein
MYFVRLRRTQGNILFFEQSAISSQRSAFSFEYILTEGQKYFVCGLKEKELKSGWSGRQGLTNIEIINPSQSPLGKGRREIAVTRSLHLLINTVTEA